MTGPTVLLRGQYAVRDALVFSGLRSAALQIVATATIAAIVGLGGLGRFLIDGLRTRDFPQMASGALVVAVLALLVDLAFAVVQRYAVSPGLTGRRAGRGRGGLGRITPSRPVARPGRASGMDPSRLTDQGAGT